MSAMKPLPFRSRAACGFGLVEVMVGLLIGLIAVLVIYQVYTVAEGFKRNTTSAGEAQQSGLFSAFTLGMEIGNAQAGMGDNATAQALAACPDPGNIATSYRPIPVLITDGGLTNLDSFVVTYSIATTIGSNALFLAAAPASSDYKIQSPGGFHVGDLIVGISTPSGGAQCTSSKVTVVQPPTANDGGVTLTHTAPTDASVNFSGSSVLVNMGPADRAQKVRYWVCNASSAPPCLSQNYGVLYSTPLLDSNGCPFGAAGCSSTAVDNPVASNVVVLKLAYGIDNIGDGQVHTWVLGSGNWDPSLVLPAPITTINQIKAVRIGIIVQSEQFDREQGTYPWSLFDGLVAGSIPASLSPPGNWRFRKYETIVPLRNPIWNKE
jgi:type IV pilus assembly protein PilW